MATKHNLTISKDYNIDCKLMSDRIFQSSIRVFVKMPSPVYWVDINGHLLGMNAAFRRLVGITKKSNRRQLVLGAFYPKLELKKFLEHQRKVVKTGVISSQLETIINTKKQSVQLQSIKIPLYNSKRKIIGIANIYNDTIKGATEGSINVEDSRQKVFKRLEDIANAIPAPFYWHDLNHYCVGFNDLSLQAVGLSSLKQVIGKSLYHFYPKDMADAMVQSREQVIKANRPLTTIETIENQKDGRIKYYEATLAPLHDDDGKVIGTYGVSIDITAQKEADQLRLENEVNQAKIEQEEKFKRITSQAVHDIRSPLASLLMIVKSCQEIQENTRLALRDAATSINDIAENLLMQWEVFERDKKPAEIADVSKIEPLLVSLTLQQALTHKRYQYQQSPVSFTHHFANDAHFAAVLVDKSRLQRVVSNLMNNAVAAYEDQKGEVELALKVDKRHVVITVSDHGKGIPEDVLEKIRKKIGITSGKKGGHGIGLTQVQDTVEEFKGKFTIDSTVGQGTVAMLRFPKATTPSWLATSVTLKKDDRIVVLDDDDSIHVAWETHFKQLQLENHRSHFTNGQETIDHIDHAKDKKNIFLLTDYELLNQPLNGIQVIEKTSFQRAVVVTSHYNDAQVRAEANKLGVRILPKQLASEVPIRVGAGPTSSKLRIAGTGSEVDLVILDDDKAFTDAFLMCFDQEDKHIDAYNDPYDLLNNVDNYAKNTIMCLDYDLSSDINGIDVAKRLHKLGYKRLHIVSGKTFDTGEVPDYSPLIKKTDIEDSVKKWW